MPVSLSDLVYEASESDPSYRSAIEIIEGKRKASDFLISPLLVYGEDLEVRRTKKDCLNEYALLYHSNRKVVPLEARALFKENLRNTPKEYLNIRVQSAQRFYWWPSMEIDLLAYTS